MTDESQIKSIEIPIDDEVIKIYQQINVSVISNMIRLFSTMIVNETIDVIHVNLNARRDEFEKVRTDIATPLFVQRVCYDIQKIENNYPSFKYTANTSILINSISLLDSFLSDALKFLLSLNPTILGDDFKVPIAMLLRSETKGCALSEAINEKVKNVGYEKIDERIKILKRLCGLNFTIAKEDISDLLDYVNQRNNIIHNMTFFSIIFNDKEKIRLKQERCPFFPTPIKVSEYYESLICILKIIKNISLCIGKQVLEIHNTQQYKDLETRYDSLIKAVNNNLKSAIEEEQSK